MSSIILSQLGGVGRLQAMINARHFVAGRNNSLVVKFRIRNALKADCFQIMPNARDLYDIEFFNMKQGALAKLDDVGVEQLIPSIENALKLRLEL